jgi:hypothetical protein
LKKEKILYLQILDWEKWYPTKYHRIPWIKLNTLFHKRSKLADENPMVRHLFIDILLEAAEQNKNGMVRLEIDSCLTRIGLRYETRATQYAHILVRYQLIQIVTAESYREMGPKKLEVRSKKEETTKTGDRQFESTNEKKQPNLLNRGEVLILVWNEVAELPKVKTISHFHRKLADDAFREQPNLDFWRGVFNKAAGVEFLMGKNKSGWRADFSWVLSKGNYARIADGVFENKGSLSDSDWEDIFKS